MTEPIVTTAIAGDSPIFQHPLVLFDGVCNLCDHTVRFIIKRDHHEVFSFIPLQSPLGKVLLTQFGFPVDYRDSFVLIDEATPYIKSNAFIRISKKLHLPWPFFSIVVVIPRSLRDFAYSKIGQNRYRWFGMHDYCESQPDEMSHRFLTELSQAQSNK
ncbi:MAG: DCC1-like thiol-disulfide oxidoreductase family protein [Nitrosomonas sp.]|nr:DCC1-like thiol-disulfide oxidoreductase family protein [Nitrosomonas sp.]